MKQFIIRTKDDRVMVTAEDRDHAFAKYFYDVITEKIPLDKIGNIVTLEGKKKDGGDDIGFRTAPLLWKMGVIGTKCAVDNIVKCVGCSRVCAKVMLRNAANEDARLVPLIDDLRLAEEEA